MLADNSFLSLFRQPWFLAPLCGWLVAQCAKMLVGFLRTGRADFSYLASTGGMPSAHSAAVSALATAVGVCVGFRSPLFSTAALFAIVVMFDAATVRRAAGAQARLLNDILDEIFREHHFSQRKLVELLGHTRLEVLAGMIVGILVALLVVALV